MGASNFHNVNANNIYAVLMNYDQPVLDDEGNETDEIETKCPEYWECNDFISFLKENAQEKALNEGVSYHHTPDSDPHELRSYASTPLFQFYKNKKFGDIDITVNINCVIRHGYYEGGNLNWYMTFDVCGNNRDEIDFFSDIDWCSEMPAGMRRIQCNKAETWADKTRDYLIEITESFFKEKSTPLGVTARFSSGETWYAPVM